MGECSRCVCGEVLISKSVLFTVKRRSVLWLKRGDSRVIKEAAKVRRSICLFILWRSATTLSDDSSDMPSLVSLSGDKGVVCLGLKLNILSSPESMTDR
jgi:hypothetical protein